ncbi:hypothetical protein PRIPAC_70738 [Pristionchus pacificus]|uniref:Uncharacterized protein n=1 Tax=Pristionchus pacificus TaxID=54126 RepID=A0A2A6CGE7_PRIPA|nr:hypothetical protein PRIPAC_70738 [Pristionchus pacificus]|eukprot:PDM77158.1 hypothetical protein PRIPAC_43070 [Pristionchus pacificus]
MGQSTRLPEERRRRRRGKKEQEERMEESDGDERKRGENKRYSPLHVNFLSTNRMRKRENRRRPRTRGKKTEKKKRRRLSRGENTKWSMCKVIEKREWMKGDRDPRRTMEWGNGYLFSLHDPLGGQTRKD